jgi:hypothetical protein
LFFLRIRINATNNIPKARAITPAPIPIPTFAPTERLLSGVVVVIGLAEAMEEVEDVIKEEVKDVIEEEVGEVVEAIAKLYPFIGTPTIQVCEVSVTDVVMTPPKSLPGVLSIAYV